MGGISRSGVEYWAAFNAISMLRFLGINVRRAGGAGSGAASRLPDRTRSYRRAVKQGRLRQRALQGNRFECQAV